MRVFLLLAAGLTLAACDATAPDLAASAEIGSQARAADARGSKLGPQLAAVRRATARYHRVDLALADGWGIGPPNEAISPCVFSDDGGMGHHYINFEFMDGVTDPITPEVLLYEPTKNGGLRLVGVEYIVLASEDDVPTPLFGQDFHWNPRQEFWALHVWVWKNNPSGMFADFNPAVSCEYAAAPGE